MKLNHVSNNVWLYYFIMLNLKALVTCKGTVRTHSLQCYKGTTDSQFLFHLWCLEVVVWAVSSSASTLSCEEKCWMLPKNETLNKQKKLHPMYPAYTFTPVLSFWGIWMNNYFHSKVRVKKKINLNWNNLMNYT